MTTIGERIRDLRAGWMTQSDLAAAADVSLSLIRKLEQGQRHTASIGSLHRIARALDVDLTALLNKPASMPSADPKSGVVAIRDALTSVDAMLGEVTDEGDPVSLAEASRVVTYAWGSYWGGRLEVLGTLLPTGLAQLRATARAVPAAQQPRAYELLAQLYTVTRCTSTRLGQPDLAWLAIRNALDAVGRGDDPLLYAMVRSAVSHQFLSQGRYDKSLRVATRAADEIEPTGDAPPAHLSAYGHLLLMAASAAGRDMRADQAVGLLDTSMEYAHRIGADRNDYETSFGVSQVTMQTVLTRSCWTCAARPLSDHANLRRRFSGQECLGVRRSTLPRSPVSSTPTRLGYPMVPLSALTTHCRSDSISAIGISTRTSGRPTGDCIARCDWCSRRTQTSSLSPTTPRYSSKLIAVARPTSRCRCGLTDRSCTYTRAIGGLRRSVGRGVAPDRSGV
jgi:transcriptional regulator with XRE-family HTH domain